MKRVLKYAVAAVVTVLAIWFSFRDIDGPALKRAFFQADYLWIALAVLNSLFSVYALGWRWRILLAAKDRPSLGALFRLNIIAQCSNIVVPARMGELVRAYMTSAESQAPGGFALGTIVIEKLFDFAAFSIFWLLVPILFAVRTRLEMNGIALFVCALAFGLLWTLARHPRLILRAVRLLSQILPERHRERISRSTGQALEAFEALRRPSIILRLTAWTIGLIGIQALTNFLVFRAFRMDVSFLAALFVLLAVQAGSLPPSLPGRIGIFEYTVILALSAFQVSKNDALSYALILHVAAFLPKILVGALFLGTARLTKKDARGRAKLK